MKVHDSFRANESESKFEYPTTPILVWPGLIAPKVKEEDLKQFSLVALTKLFIDAYHDFLTLRI